MKNRFNALLTNFQQWLENYSFSDKSLSRFRRCVYLLLLAKMVLIWPQLDVFYQHTLSHQLPDFIFSRLLFYPVFHNLYYLLWGILCGIVAFAIFYKTTRLLSVIVFVISINYLTLLSRADNLADSLLNFFIFSLIFIREGAVKGTARQMLNNVMLLALQMHFCILYFLNAYGKIIVPGWRDGSFMQLVWRIPYYADVRLVPQWFLNPGVAFVSAWSVMLFELVFAFLIWYKPARKWLLRCGLLFHIGIAVYLSLPDFGLTMLVGYFLFTDYKQTGTVPLQAPVN
ncbi:hypothetical protein ACLI09_03035 [Flavobacterium sp. RHBU_24]|uniref:hypothetical protein n=1 Tax=Flavobacterium sp. RHBU_24 TaxID=3391185 RepID=UPI003985378C